MGRRRKGDEKLNRESSKSKKSKKNRKSDPVVNDISSLLSSSLCLVSPNNTISTKDNDVIKTSKEKKLISPNVSSNSLDAFVIRTPKKATSQSDQKGTEILVSDDELELKENKRATSKKQKRKSLLETNECDEQKTDGSTPQAKRNAFQFMMDSRNKSIGTNSPGKELKVKENIVKDKEKLSARKNLLQDWADRKDGIKRKREEVERDECIALKMDKRAKRLKKLLNVSEVPKNKKRIVRIDSDTDNSRDSCINGTHLDRNRKSKNLDGFFEKLSKKTEGEDEVDRNICIYDTDEEKPQEGLKIKMFSPQVFKRKKQVQSKTIEDKTVDDVKETKSIIPNNSKYLKTKRRKKNVQVLYSENSDASNDSDTFVLRRSTRKKVPSFKFQILSENEDSDVIDVEEEEKRKHKKVTKVAPVFLLSTPKPKLDPEALEAKRKFLNMGIPDTLRKVIEKEKTYELDFDVFPKISHVQQKTSYNNSLDFWNLPNPKLDLKHLKHIHPKVGEIQRGSFTSLTESKVAIDLSPIRKLTNPKQILQKIKEDHPDYPVFKCFRVLNEKAKAFERKSAKKKRRKSKEEPVNYEMWTEKYKLTSHEDIVGNMKKVLELRKWLEDWMECVNNSQGKTEDSESEFDIDSSNCNSAGGLCNTRLLTGPHGSGKSMSVYTLCNELGINVIELNASSKRTGKRLLQELQEATQSHQVRKTEGLSNFLNTKREINDRKLCILLIEDLDLIFEQDDGLLGALSQLLTTSKRPIIITTTDINCNFLQKFVFQYPIISFSSLSTKVLSVWFQILCLLEGVIISSDDLGQLLDFYNGDVRRTLLQLQLFVQSGGSLYKDISEKRNRIESNRVEDDELNTSLFNDCTECEFFIHRNCIYNFIDKNCLVYDLHLEKIWWNLPILLELGTSLEKCVNTVDTLGLIDIIYTKSNVLERHSNSIDNQNFLKDSLELRECYDPFSNKEFVRDISDTLLHNVIDSYREVGRFEFDKPTSGQKRWLKKQKSCSSGFSDLVPFSYHTDRKNYALDYFPTLRAICRSETHRASVNVKRKNRFYNYLRTFDFKCSDSLNETACDIFSIKNDAEL